MIKIESQEDLTKLDNKEVNPLITAYIKKHFLFVCRQYKCPELSQVGAIHWLESKEDLLLHLELGLSAPLEQSVFEFAELLTLQSATESTKLWHCCFVLTNDNAISLFVPADLLLLTNLESHLKEDYTTRTIQIEERKENQCQ